MNSASMNVGVMPSAPSLPSSPLILPSDLVRPSVITSTRPPSASLSASAMPAPSLPGSPSFGTGRAATADFTATSMRVATSSMSTSAPGSPFSGNSSSRFSNASMRASSGVVASRTAPATTAAMSSSSSIHQLPDTLLEQRRIGSALLRSFGFGGFVIIGRRGNRWRGSPERVFLRITLCQRLERVVLLLQVNRIPAGSRLAIQLGAHLVDLEDAGTFLEHLHLGDRIHAQQVVEVELGAVGRAVRGHAHADAEPFVEAQFGRLDVDLKALAVILDVESLDVVVARHIAHADLVGRNVEGRADHLGGPLQLLDQLRVVRVDAQPLVFHPVAEDRDLAGVEAGVVVVPCVLEPLGVLGVDPPRRDQQSTRTRSIAEHRRAVVLDAEALRRCQPGGVDRRDADQRVEQAVEAIVNDLARRHHDG